MPLKRRWSHLVIFGSKDLPYPTCYGGGAEFLLYPVCSSSTMPTCMAPGTWNVSTFSTNLWGTVCTSFFSRYQLSSAMLVWQHFYRAKIGLNSYKIAIRPRHFYQITVFTRINARGLYFKIRDFREAFIRWGRLFEAGSLFQNFKNSENRIWTYKNKKTFMPCDQCYSHCDMLTN